MVERRPRARTHLGELMAAFHVLVVVLDGHHVSRLCWNHELDTCLQEKHCVFCDDEANQLHAEGIRAHRVEEHREKPNIGPNGEHIDGIEDVPQETNKRSRAANPAFLTGAGNPSRSLESSKCRTASTRTSSPNPRCNLRSCPDPKSQP